MTREFEVIQRHMIKAIGIYLIVIILGGLAISSLVQGLQTQIAGAGYNSILLYIVGLGSLMTAIGVYMKGKAILSTD